MSERIEITINTFHGERVLPIEGEWSAWNETTLAVKMTPAAEREMVKAATIHSKGSSCTCGGMRMPEPSGDPRVYLVPLAWIGPIGQVYDVPSGVAAAVAKCEAWLDESSRSAAAALLGRKGGSAGRGAAKRRDVDYAALARKSHESRKPKGSGMSTRPTRAATFGESNWLRSTLPGWMKD